MVHIARRSVSMMDGRIFNTVHFQVLFGGLIVSDLLLCKLLLHLLTKFKTA